MIGYHELTLNQQGGGFNNGRKQQVLVIGAVMMGAFLHTFIMAGGFQTIKTTHAIFPGGDFCYKITTRDYATSMSLVESIGKDWGFKKREVDDNYADALYTIHLDAPMSTIGADRLRFAVGHLAQTTTDSKRIHRDVLMKKNKDIVPLTNKELKELAVQSIWPRLSYKTTHLPKVKQALVAQFPFTDGIVSALMFTYKIMPTMLKQAKEAGMNEPLVVMSTCSVKQQMCTHYAVSGKPFLLGQLQTKLYASTIGPETLLPWAEVKQTLLKPLAWVGIAQDAGNVDEL
ncbi:hypothetical protein MPSEU_000376500 [Mayamaea pseudoterrestris]|nr:hypothetical protein MPSEU_000376500 [Mayamaea pseudoterrestris]